MTRLIGGTAGGRRIAVPPTGMRPTSDRVREALFSLLEARGAIEDAQVLDLFAGSGALGLEALSRGALLAVLVERDPRACAVIATNVSSTGLQGAVVRRAAVATWLRPGSPAMFDLVFVDPPYSDGVDDVLAALPRLLAPDALVVLERDVHSAAPVWPEGFEVEQPRTYGDTALHVASW